MNITSFKAVAIGLDLIQDNFAPKYNFSLFLIIILYRIVSYNNDKWRNKLYRQIQQNTLKTKSQELNNDEQLTPK